MAPIVPKDDRPYLQSLQISPFISLKPSISFGFARDRLPSSPAPIDNDVLAILANIFSVRGSYKNFSTHCSGKNFPLKYSADIASQSFYFSVTASTNLSISQSVQTSSELPSSASSASFPTTLSVIWPLAWGSGGTPESPKEPGYGPGSPWFEGFRVLDVGPFLF